MNYLLQRAAQFKKEQSIPSEQSEPVATSSEVFEKNQSAIAQSAAESFQRKRKQRAQEMVEQEQKEQQERQAQERRAQNARNQRATSGYLNNYFPGGDTNPAKPISPATGLPEGEEKVIPASARQTSKEETQESTESTEQAVAQQQPNNPFADGLVPQRSTKKTFADIVSDPWRSGEMTTEKMLEYSKTQLENYRQTEAYKARSAEKWRNNLPAYLTGGTNPAQQNTPSTYLTGGEAVSGDPIDTTEKELRSKVDYWENALLQEQEEKTTAANLAKIASWPEEDRQALNDYVKYRFQETLDSGDTNLLRYVVHMVQSKDQRAATERLREKYGEEVVEQLAETLDRVNAAEEVQNLQEAGARHGESHPILSSMASIPIDVISGLTSLPGFAHNLTTRTGQYETLNPNNPGDFSQYGGAVQAQVASDIEDTWAGKAGAYLYRGAMSAGESGLRAATGKVGTVALSALSGFTQTVSQASAQGAAPLKAVALGAVNATIEALSEEIPLDNLLQTAAEGPQAIQQVLKSAFIQAGIEASTEEVSLIGTTLAEAAILQKQGGYAQQVQKAVAEGADYQTACADAVADLLSEAADTAIVSAISGFGMSAAGSAIANHEYKKAAKAQTAAQGTDIDTDTGTDAEGNTDQLSTPDTAPEVTPEIAPEATPQLPDSPVTDTTATRQDEAAPAVETVTEQSPTPEPQPQQATTQQAQTSDLDAEIDSWDWDSGRSFMNAHPDIAKEVSDYAYDLLDDLRSEKHTFGVNWSETEEVGVFHDRYGMSASQIESALNSMAYGTALENNPHSAKIEAYIMERLASRQRTYVQTAETATPQQPQTFTPQPEEHTAQPAAPTPEQHLNTAIEETIRPSSIAQDQIQSVDTQVAENYNKNRRSQTVQDTIDRLNAGGDSSPDINEILSIPEIAEAEQANEGTPTFDLPNREKIREDGYRQAMQKGSWNGTDYSGEVNHDKRMDIVIGLPGSGKSSVYTERLSQEHKSRVIDTDDFREYIPEYNGSNASVVHEESSDIRDMVLNTALDNGDNILLSTIGANAKKLEAQIAEYKAEGYQVYLHLNELPNSKSMARAIGRYIGEDGSLGRYVSPKLIAEYGDKPTQTYLYLTGQGGTENGRLDSDLRASRGQNIGDVAQTGGTPESTTNHQGLLAGYDWYNNDVARGEAPRLIQTSDQAVQPSASPADTSSVSAKDGQPVSPPGIKGTGAAEANFTGKADYYDLLSNENSQPDRATDARPMELPKTDINGGKISAVTGNVYGSNITSDEMASLLEELTAQGALSYGEITNEQAKQMAAESLRSAGDWDSALDSFARTVANRQTGADIVARGALLLKHFSNTEEGGKWAKAMRCVQQLSDNTAQGLQAFAIIRDANDIAVSMNPISAAETAAARILDMEQEETIFNPKKYNGTFENWQTEVTENIANIAFEINAVEDGDAAAMRDIIHKIAQWRKTTAWFGHSEKLTASARKSLNNLEFSDLKVVADTQLLSMTDDFRRRTKAEVMSGLRKQSMLSSIKTICRNLQGNSAVGLLDSLGDSTTGAIMDSLLSKVTGKRTTGNDLTRSSAYIQNALDSASFASLCVELNIPIETDAATSFSSAANQDNDGKYVGKTFRSTGNPAMRALYAYQKYQSYALEVSDKIFEGGTKGAVDASLENLSDLNADERQRLADFTANRRTFKDATWQDADGKTHGAVASRLAQGAKSGIPNWLGSRTNDKVKAAAQLVVDDVAPFVSVPTNVAQTGVDYSTGIFKGAYEMASIVVDSKKGVDIPVERQRQAVSDFGRGTTGLALIALAATAAKAGVIRVGDDDDRDADSAHLSEGRDGAQINWSALCRLLKDEPTKWESDDVVSSLDSVEPFNTHMYLGAELAEEDSLWDLVKSYPAATATASFNAFMDSPMVSGLKEFVDDASDLFRSDDLSTDIPNTVAKAVGGHASSYIPQFVRQTAQYTDGYYRDTRGNNVAETTVNQLMSSIPGLSTLLPKKINGYGEEQLRPGLYGTFLDSTNTRKLQLNEITSYLDELSQETGDKSVYPDKEAPLKISVGGETIPLDGESRTTYQTVYGNSISTLYGGLMASEGFQSLPSDVQNYALHKAESYADDLAKASVSDYPDAPEEKLEDLVPQIFSDAIVKQFTDAFNDISSAHKYGKDTTEGVAALENAYSVYSNLSKQQQAQVDEDATGRVGYYMAAKDAGIATDQFVEFYDQYKQISDNGDLDTGEKANQWAYTLQKAQSSGVLTEEQKNVLKDSMGFRYSTPAEATKFDEMTSMGISEDTALKVEQLMDGIVGTGAPDEETGEKKVTNADKYSAIASSGLSQEDIDIIMLAYMPDYDPESSSVNRTELKYRYAREKMSKSSEWFADAYRVYGEYEKKDDKITTWVQQGLAANETEAENIYDLFSGNKKKIDLDAWYASLS